MGKKRAHCPNWVGDQKALNYYVITVSVFSSCVVFLLNYVAAVANPQFAALNIGETENTGRLVSALRWAVSLHHSNGKKEQSKLGLAADSFAPVLLGAGRTLIFGALS